MWSSMVNTLHKSIRRHLFSILDQVPHKKVFKIEDALSWLPEQFFLGQDLLPICYNLSDNGDYLVLEMMHRITSKNS